MAHKDFLHKLLSGEHFTQEEMTQCMNAIMNGVFPDTVIAALLALLERKGTTSTEIAGAYYSLIAKAQAIDLSEDAVDTCGTGGDHAGTYNISTVGSIIANSAGVPVAKHGNRSVTSSCGSADVLEELGFHVDLPPEATRELFARTGFSFLFAPLYHPSMKRVAQVRRDLGIRTLFNMLGPLINPARSKRQLVGVYSSDLMELYTEVLLQTGTNHAMVVHALTGEGCPLDEPSLDGPTWIVEIQNGYVCRHTVYPEDFGLQRHPLSAIKGGDRKTNAAIIRSILDGSASPAQTDAALFTSAMACYISGNARCIDDGFVLSREVLESGETERKFREIVNLNAELSARSRETVN
jgi:anthranilate phosphoribosyltransferase